MRTAHPEIPLNVSVVNPWHRTSGEDPFALLATLEINGCYVFLEALAVTTDDDNTQLTVDPDQQAKLECAEAILGDAPLTTFHHNGCDYVLVATSYAA